MLRRPPGAGVSLHGGPFPHGGSGDVRAGSYTGDLDECRWALVVGHLCEGLHEGDLRGGLLYWGTRKMRFLRDMQNALWADLAPHRGSVGQSGGGIVCWDF